MVVAQRFLSLVQSIENGDSIALKEVGFTGKIFAALTKVKLVKDAKNDAKERLDSEDGSILEVDEEAGWKLINKCIMELKNE